MEIGGVLTEIGEDGDHACALVAIGVRSRKILLVDPFSMDRDDVELIIEDGRTRGAWHGRGVILHFLSIRIGDEVVLDGDLFGHAFWMLDNGHAIIRLDGICAELEWRGLRSGCFEFQQREVELRIGESISATFTMTGFLGGSEVVGSASSSKKRALAR